MKIKCLGEEKGQQKPEVALDRENKRAQKMLGGAFVMIQMYA